MIEKNTLLFKIIINKNKEYEINDNYYSHLLDK